MIADSGHSSLAEPEEGLLDGRVKNISDLRICRSEIPRVDSGEAEEVKRQTSAPGPRLAGIVVYRAVRSGIIIIPCNMNIPIPLLDLFLFYAYYFGIGYGV